MSDETAWLIEFFGQGLPTYYGKTDEGVLGLTTDHNAAVRFSRAQDAQAVIDDTGWTEARPIEHMWCDAPMKRDALEDEPAMQASIKAHLAATKSGKLRA